MIISFDKKEHKVEYIPLVKRILRLHQVLIAFFLLLTIYMALHTQAYAAGNIYGACEGLAQTQAICTDDPCGTGVATNYPVLHYNGYLPGNQGACSQYCCSNIPLTPTATLTPTPTVTNTPTPTISPSPTLTPTATPASTLLNLTVCLHGLGNCGDNVASNGGTIHPMHMQRPVTVGLFNGSNQQVESLTGILQYSTSSANFFVTVPVPSTVPTGQYLIKIGSDGFLTKQVPGIIQITSQQTTTIPLVGLVAGNINNDNQVDILDFNLLVNCFGLKQSTSSCTTPPTANSAGSDIDDDGVVGASDYNLFLRELSVQKSN